MHSRAWWRFPITRYCIKMITQKIKSHDDRRSATWICSSFPTMIYFIDQSYMKPSKKTSAPKRSTFEIKHCIICDEVQCIWMQALQDPELEVLPDGGTRLWWLLVPVNQTYLYMSLYIIRNIHGLEFYIRWMQRLFSRGIWRKIIWRETSRIWGILERHPCM